MEAGALAIGMRKRVRNDERPFGELSRAGEALR